jgi:signal transduction histidine kinase
LRGRAEDERWHLRKDGSRFWAAGIVTALWDDAGKLRGYAKILRDITDRKLAQEKLLEESRRRDEFLAVMSHELRNPLAGIANAVEVLRRVPSAPDMVEVVARQTTTLRRLVDDLLDITRITTGKVPLKRERVSVRDIVEHAVADVSGLIESSQHTLHVELSSETIMLDADAVRLRQVVDNLLTNAAKYSPPGSTIDLRAERVGNEVLLTVRDNGIGISAELLPRIFDMFIQADRTLDRSQGGLGIGLTVAQRIVQMHGGSIEAKSAGVGRGSEFMIRLPVVPDVDGTLSTPAASVTSQKKKSLENPGG